MKHPLYRRTFYGSAKSPYLRGKFLLMLFRRTAAFLLLLVFLSQAFSRYLVIADYYVNTSTYIANCINKSRPEMHCNGRCQLCKKLHQQSAPEDQKTPERKPVNNANETFYSASSLADFNALYLATSIDLPYPELSAGKPISMPRALFHPPDGHLS